MVYNRAFLNMKKIIIATVSIACIALLVMTCKKNSSSSSSSSDDGGSNTSGMQNVSLSGKVLDTYGSPLAGVRVTTGELNAVTASDGTFSFKQAKVVDSRAIIKFDKTGYFPLTRSGVKANEMFIEAILYPKGNSNISLQTTFDASSDKTLNINGMKVDLSALSIVSANGEVYNGSINADMLYLEPNNENFAGMMPGGDLAGRRSDNSSTQLISYGMANVILTDNSGNPLQVKSGVPADITFPIPAGMESNPPATMPLWSFNEEKGIWIEEGTATLQGNVYKGKATHFSWVNCDYQGGVVNIKGKVTCNNQPVERVKIRSGQTSIFTDSKGNYSGLVPANTSVKLIVEYNNNTVSHDISGNSAGSTVTQNFEMCGGDGGYEGLDGLWCSNRYNAVTMYIEIKQNKGTMLYNRDEDISEWLWWSGVGDYFPKVGDLLLKDISSFNSGGDSFNALWFYMKSETINGVRTITGTGYKRLTLNAIKNSKGEYVSFSVDDDDEGEGEVFVTDGFYRVESIPKNKTKK